MSDLREIIEGEMPLTRKKEHKTKSAVLTQETLNRQKAAFLAGGGSIRHIPSDISRGFKSKSKQEARKRKPADWVARRSRKGAVVQLILE